MEESKAKCKIICQGSSKNWFLQKKKGSLKDWGANHLKLAKLGK